MEPLIVLNKSLSPKTVLLLSDKPLTFSARIAEIWLERFAYFLSVIACCSARYDV